MTASRTAAVALATAATVALAPAAALAAPAHHHPAHHGKHHGGHSDGHHGHHSSSRSTEARKHELRMKLRTQAAKIAALRKEIQHSKLDSRERTVMLHHVDALGHHIDGLRHHVDSVGSLRRLAKLSHVVARQAALVPAERDVLGSLHVMESRLATVTMADHRLSRDEQRCSEERRGEMAGIDTAIVDLEDAQRLLLREVQQLLAANPESLSSLQHATHVASVESRKAIEDLTKAVEALIGVESHF